MKLEEIKEKMIQGDITEETMKAFKTALNRVPKRGRCQHCYITAVKFPKKNWEQAIRLINYGLEINTDSWSDEMRAFQNMCIIYESIEDYQNALDAYKRALQAVKAEYKKSYEPTFAAEMMRVQLHCTEFKYTDELLDYYIKAEMADEFSKAFQKRMFYTALAEMVIFSEQSKIEEAEAAYERANSMLSPNYKGPLNVILRRHKYNETSGATKEAINFLSQWRK